MDPVKAEFLIEAAIYVGAAAFLFAAGYGVCRFVHRKDVKRAVDASCRSIENRYARQLKERA